MSIKKNETVLAGKKTPNVLPIETTVTAKALKRSAKTAKS